MQTDEEEKIHYLSLQTDDAVLPESRHDLLHHRQGCAVT